MSNIKELRYDDAGLIPAVIQDAGTGEVLTVAYMNADSLARTQQSGETVFFSRKRRQLWHKGETSGHFQKVVSVLADCDQDALVVRVVPQGPACHTGQRTCFFEAVDGFKSVGNENLGEVIGNLAQVIRDRKENRPEGSYTTRLFNSGHKRILQKLGEEATETILASMSGDREETVRETADLLYHLLVVLAEMDISPQEVAKEAHGAPQVIAQIAAL